MFATLVRYAPGNFSDLNGRKRRKNLAAKPSCSEPTPRPMTGLFAHLTDDQKQAALAYDGPVAFGPDELPAKKSKK